MINTMDELLAALEAGQRLDWLKASVVTGGAGAWHSLWAVAGLPGAGAAPADLNGTIPTSATAGSPRWSDPLAGYSTVLATLAAGSSIAGAAWLVDRLWASSGYSGTDAAAKVVTAPSLTRPDATGEGAELWLEVYSALGATPRTISVSYTNSSGAAKTGSGSIPASAVAGQLVPIALQSGDTGVRAVTGHQLSGSTGTVGDYGLTITRRLGLALSLLPGGAGGSDRANVIDLGKPIIQDSACLSWILLAGGASTGALIASAQLAQG